VAGLRRSAADLAARIERSGAADVPPADLRITLTIPGGTAAPGCG
jgi:hypothetical protein